jgi:hypothetical protein
MPMAKLVVGTSYLTDVFHTNEKLKQYGVPSNVSIAANVVAVATIKDVLDTFYPYYNDSKVVELHKEVTTL